jgi:hypothetical protein
MTLRRPAVPCSAHRTNGEPCANYAMHGGRVCHAHGGRAPQTRNAARLRVVEGQVTRDVVRLVEREQARREALQPWTGELGPTYGWAQRSPATLRLIAAEMREAARALCAKAAEDKGTRTW